jgi:ribonuclease Z
MTDTSIKVTLLGTGTPIPSKDRFGPSTLVEAGGRKLLVDAGRGATIRLAELDVPIGSIDALLLTHFHSDHTVGIPDVWLTGWLESHFGTRRHPFRVIGPRGADTLMAGLQTAYAADVKIRMADEKLGAEGIAVQVQEFEADGVVSDEGGVTVTAFEVDHGDAIKPAYGYSVQYAGYKIVISGDTRYNENVIKHATGADLLVHEVAIARPELLAEPHVKRIMAHHTSPRDAGTVFALSRPRLAVYTHTVFLASKQVAPATVNDLIEQTRQTYSGPLQVGEDLMCFEIGKTISTQRVQT